jgi:hypothetical protein
MYLNYNIDKIYHYLMNLKSKFLFIIKDEGSINLNILKKIKSIKHNSIHVDVDKVNIQIKFHLFYTYIILYKGKCCLQRKVILRMVLEMSWRDIIGCFSHTFHFHDFLS